jgi:hypothetical protein
MIDALCQRSSKLAVHEYLSESLFYELNAFITLLEAAQACERSRALLENRTFEKTPTQAAKDFGMVSVEVVIFDADVFLPVWFFGSRLW